jgi:hypothetical protein
MRTNHGADQTVSSRPRPLRCLQSEHLITTNTLQLASTPVCTTRSSMKCVTSTTRRALMEANLKNLWEKRNLKRKDARACPHPTE